jgi:hypothetical protein
MFSHLKEMNMQPQEDVLSSNLREMTTVSSNLKQLPIMSFDLMELTSMTLYLKELTTYPLISKLIIIFSEPKYKNTG